MQVTEVHSTCGTDQRTQRTTKEATREGMDMFRARDQRTQRTTKEATREGMNMLRARNQNAGMQGGGKRTGFRREVQSST